MMPRRRMILVLFLAATVVLSLQALTWSPDSDGPGALLEIVQPVLRANAATVRQDARRSPSAGNVSSDASKQGDSLLLRLRQQPMHASRDLFAAYSWSPPPSPQKASAAALAPEAPPLTFLYTGRIEVEGKSTFLLLQGERTLRVAIGESVGDFTLTSSGPQGLVFLHRPTGLNRVLPAPGVPIASN